MAWRLAKSLETLRMQVNAKWPGRSKKTDGAKGDDAHAARKSDHNPNDQEVVTALDITHDPMHGPDARKLAESLVASKDPRIKHLISNGEIVSGLGQDHPAWKWRRYTGENAHRTHMHISVRPLFYDHEAPWSITPIPVAPAVGSTLWVQRALNKRGAKLTEDGIDGPATAAAIRAFAISTLKGN